MFFGAKKVLLPLIVGLQCSFKQGKGKTNLKYIDDVGGPLPVIDRVVTPYKWGYANPTYRSYVPSGGKSSGPNEPRNFPRKLISLNGCLEKLTSNMHNTYIGSMRLV